VCRKWRKIAEDCSGRHKKLRDHWYYAPVVLNRGARHPRGRQQISSVARALTRPTIWKVWSINLPINTSVFTVEEAWNKGQLLENHCYTLNSNHSRTSFSTKMVSCSRHLRSRRDARVGNHTHAKRTIIRKKVQAKFKYIWIGQNRKYLHSVVITKTGRKANM